MDCGLLALTVAMAASCSRVEPKRQAAETSAAAPGYGTFRLQPETGSGRRQIFTLTLSRPGKAGVPAMIGLLVTARDGSNACYAFHVVGSGDTLLVNDSGVGSRSIGSDPRISNAQCEVERTAADVGPETVAVRFSMAFRETFRGPKTIHAIGQDASGKGTPLQQVGVYTVE